MATATGTKRRQSQGRQRYRSIVYLVLAALVFLSPVVITHLKNVEQNRVAAEYSDSVAQLSGEERAAMLERARAYNERLPEFGAPDPWVHGVDTSSAGYQDYVEQLDVHGTMARLKAPSVGMDLPVYHGTSQDTLAHGIGHLYGTALPVGGEGTHSVLTGHTGLATLTMFDNLTHMREGDVFIVEVMGEELAYEVDQILTVLPEEVGNVRPQEGEDLVTLVTCTPYGINTHRLLVRGHRTEVPMGPIDQHYRSPWQPWMIAAVVIAVLVFLYILLWLRSQRKKAKAQRAEHGMEP